MEIFKSILLILLHINIFDYIVSSFSLQPVQLSPEECQKLFERVGSGIIGGQLVLAGHRYPTTTCNDGVFFALSPSKVLGAVFIPQAMGMPHTQEAFSFTFGLKPRGGSWPLSTKLDNNLNDMARIDCSKCLKTM